MNLYFSHHLTHLLFPRKITLTFRTDIHSMKLCREDSFRRGGILPLLVCLRVPELAAVKDSLVEKDLTWTLV